MVTLSGSGYGPLSDSSGYITSFTLIFFWFGGTSTKPMSGLYRNGLCAPTESLISFDFGWSGQSAAGVFHGVSRGNTSSAARMASASGVSNTTGLSIFGIFAALIRSRRGGGSGAAGGTGRQAGRE